MPNVVSHVASVAKSPGREAAVQVGSTSSASYYPHRHTHSVLFKNETLLDGRRNLKPKDTVTQSNGACRGAVYFDTVVLVIFKIRFNPTSRGHATAAVWGPAGGRGGALSLTHFKSFKLTRRSSGMTVLIMMTPCGPCPTVQVCSSSLASVPVG